MKFNKASIAQFFRFAKERLENGTLERDVEICQAYFSSSRPTLQELADKYGVSRQRIEQIVKLVGKRGKKIVARKTREEKQKEKFEQKKQLFYSKCQAKNNGCIEWRGSMNNVTGYGIFVLVGERTTHRVAWVLKNGEIPKGLFVLHKCDNRICVNPEHLYLGTQLQNILDREERYKGIPWKKRKNSNMPRRTVS